MGRRLEYEVKTSVRLNMSNPQHVKINDVIQNLDPKIFKSKNQFIIDAIQFYIDNYGKETFAMDGLREDDEVIDAEYREVEPEETESVIDDYAIPDEPESYASNRDYVSAKGMTPQEAADEDRMVTQAEYGAEIEAETSEKDPSELQYITPIDYSKRIAELDEDLRDAAEILVTDCSCYTPFRAFLMDVVQSDFAFMSYLSLCIHITGN